jgi:hypothetical protein
MPLSIGQRLGIYEVVGSLGAGGMGEVYRARDTKLGRDVAIKVLPDHLAGDHERIVRFEREAQALAALNHPNVAQIYGTESQAIVMELVPGDDLAAVIARGPMAVDDAIAIARQIASALEAAHALSIVHRDLKPANVKVSHDGAVKVLDFGLARIGAAGDAPGQTSPFNSPTMTSPATALGMILGTAAYMSPEQARGRPVDKRADIWAFGCVLYEMLSGRPAFPGDTVTDVLAAVVTKEPDWTALPDGTPRHLRRCIRRCLQKDPKQRLHDIADARLELEAADVDQDATTIAGQPAASRARVSGLVLAAIALVAAAAGVVAGSAWRASRETPPPEWTAARLGGPAIAMYPRVSPDGHLIAFLAMVDGLTQVAVMKPAASSWTVLTTDRAHGFIEGLSWSADGSAVYYDRNAGPSIYSVPALGGVERLVLEDAGDPTALSDGSLLFARLNRSRVYQLHRFWPSTGKVEALPVSSFALSGENRTATPVDASRVVVFGHPVERTSGIDSLHMLDLGSGQLRPIAQTLGNRIRGMAPDRSGETVIAVSQDGSMSRVVRIWPDDATPPETLLTVLEHPSVSVGKDGELYVSLRTRATEIVVADPRDGAVNRLITGPTLAGGGVIALADGRMLVTSDNGSQRRILVAPPGKEPYPFVQTDEDTRPPIAPFPDGRVALMIGTASPREIAIVAGDTGRIVRRVTPPSDISSLGVSPDGGTFYFSAGGGIAAMPVDGGAARDICGGDSLAVDPATGDLIVKVQENERVRLVRCPVSGGASRDIAVRGDISMVGTGLLPTAIRHGRLMTSAGSPDSWFWFPGVVDLATGGLERVPVKYLSDFHQVGWTPDGQVVGAAAGIQSVLWKFERKRQ